MPTGRDLLFRVLDQLAIPFVFGVSPPPGNDRLASPAQPTAATFVGAPTDAIAVGMAMGFARASGKVGVVEVDLIRALAAVHHASRAHVPLVVLSPPQPNVREPDSQHLAPHDIVAVARPFSRWVHAVGAADELPLALQRAFKAAVALPGGPVVLALTSDSLSAQTQLCAPPIVQTGSGVHADEVEVARGAALLAASEDPLLIAGDGVGLSDAWPELVTVAERLGVPVRTEARPSIWNFPNRHPHWHGELPREAAALRELLVDRDLVVLCGTGQQIPPRTFERAAPRLVLVSDDPETVDAYPMAEASLVGDVKLNLTSLLSAIRATSQPRSAFAAATRRRASLEQAATERRAEWDQRVASAREGSSISTLLVAADLAAQLPKDAIVCDELGSSREPFLHLLDFTSPRAYWGHPGLSGAALGMPLARPDAAVVNLIDAPGLLGNLQVLAGAAGRVVFVVLRHARTAGVESTKIAEGMGIRAERAVESNELRPALERAFAAGSPYLVDVRVSE